jgi:UDP-glucuronate decarboxylase
LMEADIDGTEPVNLGNPEELTVSQLADMIRTITGASGEVVYLPLPQDDPRRRRPDITRAKEWLNWKPRVRIHEGLRRTCAWFASAPDLTCASMPQVTRSREAVAAE